MFSQALVDAVYQGFSSVMVTLKDIAEKTGFSLSVVSRAMNPRPDQKVAEKSRKIILAAANELGYRPNLAASLLAKGHSTSIGCFLPLNVGEMVGRMVSGLADTANAAGIAYNIYFGNSIEDYRQFINYCRHISSAGMITYLPANIMHDPAGKEFYNMICNLTDKSGEVVLLNCPEIDLPHVQTICIDNNLIGSMVAEYLMSKNCDDYVLMTSPVNNKSSYQMIQRCNGFLQTLAGHGIRGEYVVPGEYDYYRIKSTRCIDELRRRLDDGKTVGIFMLTDYEALSLYWALVKAQLHHLIGKSIKIVGCDNIMNSSIAAPALTTVSLLDSFYALGEISMKMLLNKLLKMQLPINMSLLKPQLVVRDSA